MCEYVHASGVCVCICVFLFVICVPSINDSSPSVSHALSARLSRESVVCSVPACVLDESSRYGHICLQSDKSAPKKDVMSQVGWR